MNRVALIAALLVCSTSIAAAQTEGRVSVGASVTYVNPTSDGLDSVVGIGPLVRLNPRRGWGPAGAFNWFRADVRNPSGADGDFARLRVRPLMAGVAYTVGSGNVLTSFSVVAGPSFNSIDFEDDYLDNLPQGGVAPAIDVENSIAVRPGVNVTVTVAPRVAVVGFGGYLFNRPDTLYRDRTGAEFRNQWKADSFVVSAGVVYSLF
jgi:Outer membrane protein beta-barrel domain